MYGDEACVGAPSLSQDDALRALQVRLRRAAADFVAIVMRTRKEDASV